jgi:hypothetical protein
MLVHIPTITDKKYRRLALEVSLEGLSLCVWDTLNHRILSFRDVKFNKPEITTPIEESLSVAFRNTIELTEKYDEIMIVHSNCLSTFVPVALFDAHYLGSYLQYSAKVFESDFFAFDEISVFHMNVVYVPYAHINNFLIDEFGNFDYKHASTILVTTLLQASKNIDDKKMFVHFDADHFEIVVVQNQNLLLFNSFEYKNPEDFVYYLLFTAEQLNLNPESFKLELLGNISEESDFFKLAYKYIRNVSLYDTADMQTHNHFTAGENRKHFILFHS